MLDASRRGKKVLHPSRDKSDGAYRSGRGERGPFSDPGSDYEFCVYRGGEGEKKISKVIDGMSTRTKQNNNKKK